MILPFPERWVEIEERLDCPGRGSVWFQRDYCVFRPGEITRDRKELDMYANHRSSTSTSSPTLTSSVPSGMMIRQLAFTIDERIFETCDPVDRTTIEPFRCSRI